MATGLPPVVEGAAGNVFKGGGPHRLEIEAALRHEVAMLDQLARGQAPSRVLAWECGLCLVVPRRFASMTSFPSAARESGRRGFPVILRETGGDAVIQGSGVLNITTVFTLPPGLPDGIGEAYRRVELLPPATRVQHPTRWRS